MSRGNRKGSIFGDDDDRRRFLAVVSNSACRHGIRVYAYCLMENHYHLAFDAPRNNLSVAMQYINGVFTQWSNRRHRRTGRLFEARFRSLVVPRELYLKRVARYIVLNPVRARLVANPAEWPWSSYSATAGIGQAPDFLYLDWVGWAFCRSSADQPAVMYRRFVERGPMLRSTLSLPAIAANQDDVLQELQSSEGRDRWLPHTHREHVRPSLADLFGRAETDCRLRHRLIYEAHATYGYSLVEIATALRLHPSTPGIILRRLRDHNGH